MRCGTPVTLYAFTTSTGTERQALNTVTLSGDVLECPASSFVMLTQAEYSEVAASPFRLSLAEGAQIGAAIMAVWAVGFGVRAVIRTFKADPLPDEG